ncbi:MAG: hypothetical protein ABW140_17110 [Candidatus Sedimenticola sp. 6PFRAG1]
MLNLYKTAKSSTGTHKVTTLILCCLILVAISGCDSDKTPSESSRTRPVEYGPDVRTITVTGTIDPRLSAWVRTTYRPTEYSGKRRAECTRSDFNTASRKGLLDWEFENIVPDESNHFRVSLPIDYVKKNKCGYEYVDTVIRIQRDYRDDRYADITLLGTHKIPLDVYTGTRTGIGGGRLHSGFTYPKTGKHYYRLARGSRIECHTDFYVSTNRASFSCIPLGGDGDHGTDKIESQNFNVDVLVNDDVSMYIYDSRVKPGGKKDHFRDYVPPPPTLLQKLNNNIDSLFCSRSRRIIAAHKYFPRA